MDSYSFLFSKVFDEPSWNRIYPETMKQEFDTNPYLKEFYEATKNVSYVALENRYKLVSKYAWAIPNAEAIKSIKKVTGDKKLVEHGAGTGYWASLLQKEGISVTAYDLKPYQNKHS